MSENLARRSVNSVKWNGMSMVLHHTLNTVRLIVLARLLPIETFGLYASAHAVIILLMSITDFGLGAAFLHRAPESEDEDQALALHFTLKLLFVLAMTVILFTVILLADSAPDLRTALLTLLITQFFFQLCFTPRVLLIRRVQHQRLSMLQVADILITTPLSIGLALSGATLWALLASNISTALVHTIGLYIWKPIWRPRLIWHPAGMRYFLSFGSRMAFASWLTRALDNFDDVWTGIFLGQHALGFYSRAYQVAKLPSMLLAGPVSTVAAGVYAEITDNRKSLSRAFLLTNAAMVRTGFLLAGMLALVAPELISLLIGERWLPAVAAFRLMLLYALFEPIKSNIGLLYAAVGNPGLLGRLRFIQLVVLIVGLFALGTPFGIEGVALAVDLMLVVGIFMMLHYARRYVDFSLRDLFLVPCVAVIAGLLSSIGLTVIGAALSVWLLAVGKLVVFATVYGLILVIADRQLIGQLLNFGRNHLRKLPHVA